MNRNTSMARSSTKSWAQRVSRVLVWVLFAAAGLAALTIVFADAGSRSICLSGECWTTAATLFDVPVKLAAAGLIILGANVGYQKLRIADDQIDQLNYKDFRDEFTETPDAWVGAEYSVLIQLTRLSVFKSLYPEARSGNQNMAREAEAVMVKELVVAFNALADVSLSDPARYRAGTYLEPLFGAYHPLREVLGWDAEWNPSFTDPLLKGDFGEKYCGIARDVLAIASAANEFEGSRFFDHETRRRWRRGVDRLCESVEHANGINQFFSDPQYGQWLNYLMRSDFDEAGSIDPISLLPDSLRSVQAVRNYIYEAAVKSGGIELLTDEDQKRQVAQQLGIQYPYQL